MKVIKMAECEVGPKTLENSKSGGTKTLDGYVKNWKYCSNVNEEMMFEFVYTLNG